MKMKKYKPVLLWTFVGHDGEIIVDGSTSLGNCLAMPNCTTRAAARQACCSCDRVVRVRIEVVKKGGAK